MRVQPLRGTGQAESLSQGGQATGDRQAEYASLCADTWGIWPVTLTIKINSVAINALILYVLTRNGDTLVDRRGGDVKLFFLK